MKTSKGEEKIISLLKQGKYKFEREKRFKDLKHGMYRFDFYVVGGRPKNCIIEVQGEQHYKYIAKFYRSRAEFMAAQERDRRKISYCLANNIPIYVIPYWELENLTSADEIFTEKFRARSRWKNDQDKRKFDMRANF